MLLTRQNKLGGPKLNSCPLVADQKTGTLYHKIGYCEGCNEPLGIRTVELKEVLDLFGPYYTSYKTPFRHRLIKWLGGSVDKQY